VNYTNANFTTAVLTSHTLVHEGPCMVGNIRIQAQAVGDTTDLHIQVFDALTSVGTSVFSEKLAPDTALTIPGDWRFNTGLYVHYTDTGTTPVRVTLQYAPRPSNQ